MKFSNKDFSSKCDQISKTADLVTFTGEILNGKLHFLWSHISDIKSDEMNYFVLSVIKSCQISEDCLQQIKKETQKDDIVHSVVLQIQNGWIDPDTTKVKPYLTVKDSLTLYKKLVLKDLRVSIPVDLKF